VKADRPAHFLLDLLHRRTGGDAARKVGQVSGSISLSLLDDDCVARCDLPLSPACLRMLLGIPERS
jgi:hypothetical protein